MELQSIKPDRIENWDALHAMMSGWSRPHTKQWIADAAQTARVPSFPLQEPGEQFDSAQPAHLGFFRPLEILGQTEEATILAWRLALDKNFHLFTIRFPKVTDKMLEKEKYSPLLENKISYGAVDEADVITSFDGLFDLYKNTNKEQIYIKSSNYFEYYYNKNNKNDLYKIRKGTHLLCMNNGNIMKYIFDII